MTVAELEATLRAEWEARLEAERAGWEARREIERAEWEARREAERAEWEARREAERETDREAQRQSMTEAQRLALRASGRNMVASGERLLGIGSWQATLDRYRQALGLLLEDPDTAAVLVEQIAAAGYGIGAERDAAARALLPERIALVRRELAGSAVPEPESPATDFAALLQAKLLLWQIIGSEPLTSRYPELRDTMQAYFATFASEQRAAGRDAALRDVLALVEALGPGLTAKGGGDESAARLTALSSAALSSAKGAPESEREIFIRLLGDVEALLRE